MDQGTHSLIKRHNEQIRDLIVRDIDALENKLNVKRQVSNKADHAVGKLKGTIGMKNRNPNEGWADFVRHNAAPLLAVGLGGTVLARNVKERVDATDRYATTGTYTSQQSFDPTDSGSSGGGLKEKAGSVVGSVQSTASGSVEGVKEKVSDAGQVVGERASSAKEAVTDTVSTAKETVAMQASHAKEVVVEHVPSRDEAKQMAHEHSRLLGVAALAAGALVGTLAPRTRAEERKLAPLQSQVKDRATDLVESGVDKAKETADRAADALGAAAETAKEEFSDSGDSEPPSGDADGSMPNLTTPNRITGERTTAPTGVDGVSY